MAYDQVFQENGIKQSFEDTSEIPSLPTADIRWVESVSRYALNYINPRKLVLGVPTYGWEFQLTKIPTGHRYTRVKSVSYPEKMDKNKALPQRGPGGELSFIYKAADGENMVTFSDAEAVRQKIKLAKDLGIRGISLFKIDGLADPEIFSAIKEARTE